MTKKEIIEDIKHFCGENCIVNEDEIKTPKLQIEFDEKLLLPGVYDIRFRSSSTFVHILSKDVLQIGFLQGKLRVSTSNSCTFNLEI